MTVRNQIKTLKPWRFSSRLFLFTLIIIVLAAPATLIAQKSFDFSETARKAYDAALSLQFEASRTACQQLRDEEPENLIVYLIENYIDFFTVFINEEYDQFRALEKNKSDRLQKIRQGDSSSPYYKYCEAEIQLHWALARLKFEEYFTAFIEVKNAYKLLRQNEQAFPDFIANKKSLGVIHALVGTIPENYQWGVKLLGGMEGDIEKGQKEIELIIDHAKTNDFIFRAETGVMYSFLMLHLKNNGDRAWRNIQELRLDHRTNPLAAFTLANIALRTGRNDKAIQFLEERPNGDQFASFPYLNYLLGLAKLYRQDADASDYLQKYIDEFRGVNYIKEAYQKMAWAHLIEGQEKDYYDKMALCEKYGGKVIGGDKMAMREAEGKKAPNAILIKARLQFDGGYHEAALKTLKSNESSFMQGEDRLEYLYRLARTQQELGKHTTAIANYENTIKEGRDAPEYFACNAALQLGIIYEQLEVNAQAIKYFKECLSIKPSEYKSSLHQKAKAGLLRLK